jgi:serine/threonine protein kinase
MRQCASADILSDIEIAMKAKPATHPGADELAAFAQGRIVGARFDVLEEHIRTCDSCCALMAKQPDQTLMLLAREAATHGLSQPQASYASSREIPAALQNHPRYKLLEPIGKGGMGSVFKAEHRVMHRTVAVKVIHPRLLANPEAVERFRREVRVAAQLKHPNVVVSHDADQADNTHFLVMEYVNGENLDAIVNRNGPATIEQACDWIRQAALGLEHAHEQGMVHRDIKPQNLMLTSDGQVKILDFGLTRVRGDVAQPTGDTLGLVANDSHTRADIVLGTPDYIAPEQISHASAVDARCDLYSLGCTLFFLLTGRPPFGQGSVAERLRAHHRGEFPSLLSIRPDAPVELQTILQRMISRNPADRYQRASDVARDLDSFLEQRKRDKFPPSTKTLSRWAWIATVAGAVLLLVVAWSLGIVPLTHRSSTRLLVLLPSKGLWYPDYQGLVKSAGSANVRLTFAGLSDKQSELVSTSPSGVALREIPLDASLKADDYDGIVFIGYETGEFAPNGVGGDDTGRLIRDFQRQKKVVASLCAGQRLLAQHGALQGKRVSACQYVTADEVRYGGGTTASEEVTADGSLVTAGDSSGAAILLREISKIANR